MNIRPGLEAIQLGVEASPPHQRGVAALFYDAARVEDDDQVGHLDGGEAVRHEYGDRAASAEAALPAPGGGGEPLE